MNKKIMISALIGIALCSAQTMVHAADGTINFTGEIVAAGCDINGGTTPAIDVDLGSVSASSFSGVGSTSSPTQFTISLSQCPSTFTSATVKFDGQPDADDPALLAVSGGATGVGIELDDQLGAPVPLQAASRSYPINGSTQALDMVFTARFKATQPVVSEGAANATSQFTINYQ